MAGLLQQQMTQPSAQPSAQPGAPQQPQPQQRGAQQPDKRVDVDPEQAASQRNALVSAMLTPLYDKMMPQATKALQQSEDPIQGIARILSNLLITAWQAMNDQGKTIPPGIMLQAGMIAAQAVGDIAIRVGTLPQENNGDAVEAAFMVAMGQFGKVAKKDMPPEQRERYRDLIESIRDAKNATQGGDAMQQREQAMPGGQ